MTNEKRSRVYYYCFVGVIYNAKKTAYMPNHFHPQLMQPSTMHASDLAFPMFKHDKYSYTISLFGFVSELMVS